MSALQGWKIVELAERVTGEYTGKLLADFGAEVIKVERPGGSPTRAMGPFAGDHAGPEQSALFAYLNTNKKSVVLDLSQEQDIVTLHRLLSMADAVIDDHDAAWAEAIGLSPERLAAEHPALVACAITPFGQGAPADWQQARPLNVMNAGGWAYHTPSESDGSKPPLKGAGRFMSDYEAGIDAALCVVSSLYRKHQCGKGQYIDISEVEVQLSRTDCVLGRMLAGEVEPGPEHGKYDMGGPGTSFACKDGQVYLIMTTAKHWSGLCTLMGEPEWTTAFPADWLEYGCTAERVADFRAGFAQWVLGEDKDVVSEAAQKLGVPIVPVNTAADLHRSVQYVHRGYFQSLHHPVLGDALYPTAPYKLSATPVQLTSPAPLLGQDSAAVLTAAQTEGA